MDEKIEFLINEDIEQYKTEIWKGLNLQQITGVAMTLVTAISLFLFFHFLFLVPLMISTWMALFLCIPVAVIFFVKIEGLTFIEFLKRKWEYAFGCGFYYSSSAFCEFESLLHQEEEIAKEKRKRRLFKMKDKNPEEDREINLNTSYSTEDSLDDYSADNDFDWDDDLFGEDEESDKYKDFLDVDQDIRNLKAAFSQEEIESVFATSKKPSSVIPTFKPEKRDPVINIDIEEQRKKERELAKDFSYEDIEIECEDTGYLDDTMLLVDDSQPKFSLVHKTTGNRYFIKDGFKVGRNQSYADLYIDNKTVSGKHAIFTVKNDALLIKDIGSKNGTFLNGVKLQPGFNVEVAPGSTLKFSNVEYDVE